MAPVDRRAKGLLALGARAAAARQQAEPVVGHREHLLDGERARPRRRQLDRERDAVEPAAEIGDRGRVPLGDDEGRPARRRPFDEEARGLEPFEVSGLQRRAGRRQRERQHRLEHLAHDPERLAARRQHAQARARPQQRPDRPRAGVRQMLAVVEHEQQLPRRRRVGERRHRRAARLLANAERRADRRRNQGRVGEPAELDQPHAVAEAVDHRARDLEREPGLSDSARTDERHEPVAREQLLGARDLLSAPDEARQRARQVVRRGRAPDRPERRVGRPRAAECMAEVGDGLEAIGRQLCQRAQQRRLDLGGDLGALPPRRSRLLGHVLRHHGRDRLGLERRASDEHVVEHAPERVDVGASVDRLAAALLGRHVGRRAEHRAPERRRRGVRASAPLQLCDPEVEHLGDRAAVRLFEHDVVGLEVAVDHARFVGRVNGRADLSHQGDGAIDRQPPELFELGAQRAAVDELHHEVHPDLGRRSEVVDRHDVRMLEVRDRARLAQKAVRHPRVGEQVVADDLERHGSIERQVGRAVDGAHAASGEERLDPVAPLDDRARFRTGLLGRRRDLGRQEAADLSVRAEQRLDLVAKLGVAGALRVEERGPLPLLPLERGVEERLQPLPALTVHPVSPRSSPGAAMPSPSTSRA